MHLSVGMTINTCQSMSCKITVSVIEISFLEILIKIKKYIVLETSAIQRNSTSASSAADGEATHPTHPTNVRNNFMFDDDFSRRTYETLPYIDNISFTSSEDENKEIAMCKRHKNYFKTVLEIKVKKWCDLRQYESLSVIRDMNLFIARYAHLIDFDINCDSCSVSLPLEKYRCLICLDLDLCESCYTNGIIPISHVGTHRMIELR